MEWVPAAASLMTARHPATTTSRDRHKGNGAQPFNSIRHGRQLNLWVLERA